MERLLALFRAQPALLVMAMLVGIGTVVLGIFVVGFSRAGLSLRPVWFMAIFIGLILGPQAVYHVLVALRVIPDIARHISTPSAPRATDPATDPDPRGGPAMTDVDAVLATDEGGRFRQPAQVFGAGFDPDLISDVRPLFASFAPEVAQMAIVHPGQMVVVARFVDGAAAEAAATLYLRQMGVPSGRRGADGAITGARAGDVVRVFVAGRTLFAWSGADAAALDQRMAASRSAWQPASPLAVEASQPRAVTPAVPAPAPDAATIRRWRLGAFAFLVVNLLLASAWFFKGSAWAAAVPGRPQAWPATAGELRSRLLAVNTLGQPLSVTPGAQPDELIVTWRYADAAWLDQARAHRLTRVHRLVLRLDEARQVVRVRESSSAFDASAGVDGARLSWRRDWGITFFAYEHQRVFGLQLDPATGRLRPNASYAYTFNLQELKTPFIAAATHAGWRWQPVLLDLPPGLRWLGE